MNIFEKKVKEFEAKVARGERVNRPRAIRMKCLDCCCYQPAEVSKCTITDCCLYPFRFGKDPFTKKKGNISNLKR